MQSAFISLQIEQYFTHLSGIYSLDGVIIAQTKYKDFPTILVYNEPNFPEGILTA